jgi:hypothetical protein
VNPCKPYSSPSSPGEKTTQRKRLMGKQLTRNSSREPCETPWGDHRDQRTESHYLGGTKLPYPGYFAIVGLQTPYVSSTGCSVTIRPSLAVANSTQTQLLTSKLQDPTASNSANNTLAGKDRRCQHPRSAATSAPTGAGQREALAASAVRCAHL